ncbi:MAG: GNAT family N-acetyltransferase [Gemmobacter sp.]
MTRLDTPRLVLRHPEPGDWPAYFACCASARSPLGVDCPEGKAWTNFAAFFGHWHLRGFGRFVLTRRDTGAAIGHAGPFRPAGHPEREITWTIWDPACEGQGYAFEAAVATRDHAFRDLGWPTAVSYIDPANTRSQRLAARLGAVIDPAARPPADFPAEVWRHRRAA